MIWISTDVAELHMIRLCRNRYGVTLQSFLHDLFKVQIHELYVNLASWQMTNFKPAMCFNDTFWYSFFFQIYVR